MAADDAVEIGTVTRPHGVRGELRVVLHNQDSDALSGAETVLVRGEPYQVTSARPTRGAVLLTLREVRDRNAAEVLRGAPVAVYREELQLGGDEVLLVDLIGCEAVLEDGSSWGQVVGVIPGAQDRLVIRSGEVERELPVVDAFIGEIDLEARRVVVSPPEGLPETAIE